VPTYAYGRWQIATETALPELPLACGAGRAPDYSYVVGPPRQRLAGLDWSYRIDTADGDTDVRVAHVDGSYHLDFPRRARFHFDPAQRAIRATPRLGTDPGQIRHLLLDHVIPRLLNLTGAAVLHATAVRLPHGAVAFVGDTGAGKSTLAVSLALAGHQLLADDCCIIELAPDRSASIIPSYPAARLWGPSGRALLGLDDDPDRKHLVTGIGDQPWDPSPAPLRAVYALDAPTSGPPACVAIDPVTSAAAFAVLVAHAFHLEPVGSGANLELLDRFSALTGAVDVRRLAYPRRHDMLARVHTALAADR